MTQEADPKLDELRKAVDRSCNTYGLTYPRGGATLRVDAFEALEAYIAGRERERWEAAATTALADLGWEHPALSALRALLQPEQGGQ